MIGYNFMNLNGFGIEKTRICGNDIWGKLRDKGILWYGLIKCLYWGEIIEWCLNIKKRRIEFGLLIEGVSIKLFGYWGSDYFSVLFLTWLIIWFDFLLIRCFLQLVFQIIDLIFFLILDIFMLLCWCVLLLSKMSFLEL